VDAALREVVRVRAGDRCEYCRIRQQHVPYARLQVEHVRPKKHGGDDSLENLALACNRCNLSKGPNLSGIDPAAGDVVVLFNPRVQRWED
jgi:5-methylcytosine-specific restriction endonuclease McrA